MDFIPADKTIEEKQQEILHRFNFFDTWNDKYAYLMDYAKKLPDFDPAWRTEENRVAECNTPAWVKTFVKDGRLYFSADSDTDMANGILGLMVYLLSGQKADDILNAKMDFLDEMGLMEHLSPSRAHGLKSLIQMLLQKAKEASGS